MNVRLVAAVAAAAAALASAASNPVPAPLPTACALSWQEAAGFVTNPGPGVLVVSGPVRFTFEASGTMTRPEITQQAQALVQPGETARVATARLEHRPVDAELCRFDVSQALGRSVP